MADQCAWCNREFPAMTRASSFVCNDCCQAFFYLAALFKRHPWITKSPELPQFIREVIFKAALEKAIR